jgi:hypothetical protein
MDGCPLCIGEHRRPTRAASITPIYDASVYRQLADAATAGELFSEQQPATAGPGEEALYAKLADAELPATMERMSELQAMARAQAWQLAGPPFFDFTVYAHISAALLWAGLLATAEHPRRAEDHAEVQRRERDAAKVCVAVAEGNREAVKYLQDKAGCVRFGSGDWSGTDRHYKLGRWEDAHNWVVGSFQQYVSRNGNPRLHVHNLVLNLVQTDQTGEWGRLDGNGLYRVQDAAAAVGLMAIESALTRDLGVCWVRRADGHGREIAGASQDVMDLFSDEQEAMSADTRPAAAQHEQAESARPMSLRDELKQMGWSL